MYIECSDIVLRDLNVVIKDFNQNPKHLKVQAYSGRGFGIQTTIDKSKDAFNIGV
jgi:hypothetical protein